MSSRRCDIFMEYNAMRNQTVKEAAQRLIRFLITVGLDEDSPSYKSLNIILNENVKLRERLSSLEDIDEVAGKYRDLAEEAIDELCSTEDQSAINYGYADRLRNKFEEIAKWTK